MDRVQRFIEENQYQLGYIMGEASRKWIANDPVGALTVGDCNVFVQKYGQYHEVVEKMGRYEERIQKVENILFCSDYTNEEKIDLINSTIFVE